MIFPGKILNKLEGNYYHVECYVEGLLGPVSYCTVRQLQIAENEKIPEGTWALICRVGYEYYMQVPIWI